MSEENSNLKPNSKGSEKAQNGGAGDATLDPAGTSGASTNAGGCTAIGSYVLVKILGVGGMGQVWLAEQTAPVKRQVALKLIKGGLYDSAVIQRFESERQSLAVMNHPAIAKVFDAGSTADGQPYFVMEYVEGPRITQYCDNNKLKIRERLELFIKVCEGVQHAHQKAIIHRDLKPSNVLVVEVDGKPVPRIIDFGIAKAISSQANAEQTMLTQAGALVGTPGFMSPEQGDPRVQDVDTRADVYSLGVILYVLLTGTLPFDLEGWKKKPVDEVLRQLREEDPKTPSTKLREEKESATDSAAKRATEPGQLVSMLRGDLDWITMRAIEKDRARRYGTPSELAVDIERYLQNKPVVARPASAGYRLKKYAQRHRLAVASAAGVAALLTAFAINQAVQLRRITRERDRANRITDFMTDMFKVSDPSVARGNAITAREILDKASKGIDTGLAKDPELQAQMMQVMGIVYDNLGLYPQAESLTASAVEILKHVSGTKNPSTLAAEQRLGWEFFREGRNSEAEKLLRHMLDESRRVLGPTHPTTLAGIGALGVTLNEEGQYAEAEKLEREALDIAARTGPEHFFTVEAMDNLAHVLTNEGQLAEAEKLYRHTLEIHRRVRGPEHPITLIALHNLGGVIVSEDRPAEAEKFYREAVATGRRVLGPNHPDAALYMNDLANVLSDEHQYEEAEKLNREALEIRRRVFGPDHRITASSVYNLGCLAALMGRRDEALALLSQAVDHGLGPDLDMGMAKDSDLKSLHGDRRFDALVKHAQERGTAAQKTN